MEEERQVVFRQRWYSVLTGILSLTVLGINLAMIKRLAAGYIEKPETEEVILKFDYALILPAVLGVFLFLILLHLVQCFAYSRESLLLMFKHLLYILLCGGSVVLLVFKGDSPEVWPLACFLYLIATLADCVIEFIQKRVKWKIVLLVIMLIVAIFGALLMSLPHLPVEAMQEGGIDDPVGMAVLLALCTLFLLVDIQAVLQIMPIAFAQVRMDILKGIIRKTYAVEILSGIVLLIVAFSFILPAFEPEIEDLGDALWYCFAIVTTIGFGDYFATSFIGRIMSVILGIYGIIVVSLITSIIVNFYSEVKKEESREADEEKLNSAAGGGNREIGSDN